MGILNRLFGGYREQLESDQTKQSPPNDWPSSLKITGQHLAWGAGHKLSLDVSEFTRSDFQLILHGGPIAVPQGPNRSVFDRLEQEVLSKIRNAPDFKDISNQDTKYLTGMARLKIALSMAVVSDMDLGACMLLVQQ